MPANEYYDSTGAPSQGSTGTSSTMRSEFDAIESGFNKLPTLTGNAEKIIRVNSGATGLEPRTDAQMRTQLDVYSKAESDALNVVSYVMVSETQVDGTQGGTFTSGSWQTRTINSEDSDTDGICSISSNQITLDAGTYRCSISAPAYAVDNHQIRLRNITDAATTLVGTSAFSYSAATGYATNRSWIKGQFTIAAQKTFEVQHIGETTSADSGLGGAGNADYGEVEIYTIAEFWTVE